MCSAGRYSGNSNIGSFSACRNLDSCNCRQVFWKFVMLVRILTLIMMTLEQGIYFKIYGNLNFISSMRTHVIFCYSMPYKSIVSFCTESSICIYFKWGEHNYVIAQCIENLCITPKVLSWSPWRQHIFRVSDASGELQFEEIKTGDITIEDFESGVSSSKSIRVG